MHIRQVPELGSPAPEKWHTPLHDQEPWAPLGDLASAASVVEVAGGGGFGPEP